MSPRELERGLQGLTPGEQRTWTGAVTAYAAGLSLMNNLDERMTSVTRALAGIGDRPNLAGTSLDPALVAVLERSAPTEKRGGRRILMLIVHGAHLLKTWSIDMAARRSTLAAVMPGIAF